MLANLTATELLAAFMGIYMVAAGIGLLTDRDNSYAKVIPEIRDNTALGYVVGVFVFVLGAVLIAVHNQWNRPLAIVVSLISWGALIEGVLMLAARRPFLDLVSRIPTSAKVMKSFGIGTVVLGIGLLIGALAL